MDMRANLKGVELAKDGVLLATKKNDNELRYIKYVKIDKFINVDYLASNQMIFLILFAF